MILKRAIYVTCVVTNLWVGTSCTSDFDGMNTDPNLPTKGSVELLLNPVVHSLVMNQFNYNNGSALAHHLARTNYNEIEQYAFNTNMGTWNSLYLQLNNIQEIIQIAEQEHKPSSQAVGMILKAFTISQITDLWGDVPYAEATQGGANVTPVYDSQKDIYTGEEGIINLLKKAEVLLSDNTDPIPEDLVYNGDRMKWRKLANSLRLRYLMRLTNKMNELPFNLQTELEEVNNLPLLKENSDNMQLAFLTGSPNKCPIYDMRSGEFEYVRMSEEMHRMWQEFSDPRIPVWFDPTSNTAGTASLDYRGVPVGCSSTTLTRIGYSQSDVSLLNAVYRRMPNSCNAVLMNAAEVDFLLAEAVVRKLIPGNAEEHYLNGITHSMEYYGITDYDDYLAKEGIRYDSEKSLQLIMRQKWMALFMVGYESWFDFLRTGLPEQDKLLDNRNPTSPDEIPSRFYYPEDEQALNGKNYTDAINRQGGKDDINTELWWE